MKKPAIEITRQLLVNDDLNIPTEEECLASEERLKRLQRQLEDLKRLRSLALAIKEATPPSRDDDRP